MKRILLVLLVLLILSSIFYILENVFYRDDIEFLSPLEIKTFKIRDDRYGDGYFGAKRKDGRVHQGVDLLAPSGMPVKASKSGWALRRLDEDGYGIYIKIYHRGKLATLYAHLKDANVAWLEKVRQGEVIGWVGNSGNARYKGIKPHLHFEVREDGIPVDPMKGYLR